MNKNNLTYIQFITAISIFYLVGMIVIARQNADVLDAIKSLEQTIIEEQCYDNNTVWATNVWCVSRSLYEYNECE